MSRADTAFAALILLAILVLAAAAARGLSAKGAAPQKDGMAGAVRVARDALGHEIPVPGSPDRGVLRRTRPYPPTRYPQGGLADFYFPRDPAHASDFDADLCLRAPAACAGYALEPFHPTR